MSLRDHPHPALTADVVVFVLRGDDLRLLLIQRANPPFVGAWALPGGFVEVGESPEAAARRELKEETGIQDVPLEQLGAFGAPGRDPRGHVVTVVYLAWMPADAPLQPRAGDDAAGIRWWSVRDMPQLAFDHDDIVACALERLRSQLTCAIADLETLPEIPTLEELRTVYAILEGISE